MAAAAASRNRKRDVLAFTGAGLLPVPWMVCHNFHGFPLPAEAVAALSGLAILGGAFLLSWATELAERDIPQALAILVLALVSVLPEYAIDLHFAWTAGKDPSYAPYAIANMTGANRLLIGLGWALVVLIFCWRSRAPELLIHPRQTLEIRFLLWATAYSFLIPLTGTVNLFDAAVLLAIFLLYAYSAMRSESEEVQLVGPAALFDREFGDWGRRLWAVGLFAFAAWGIFISAEPFAESLVEIGRYRDIDEFLLVQWVAPLASESPEFLIATLFALRLRGSVGIGALISSKVNQWTLLVGAIPIAFALSAGNLSGLPLDDRQTQELILTSAQSLFAVLIICDLRFTRIEALGLAALFGGQFMFASTEVRYVFIALYLVSSAVMLLDRGRRRLFFALLFGSVRSEWKG
ncbi:MAG: sodium:calcium antiporter [Myxococcota bacterium]|jgi:cation:H+ antiporter|nr:sodium:proton exchanger [Deltaproteobacteria bacterium]MCP4244879.1 sodium:calcium antiporter [bacterium]MDP6074836.1 sodium:calcium antiporter [Myxococcota bacterium]MDP6243982.1 sodium:calcium antiporter [Myxococcota bacterium]MDP7075777.1 sodium:calcium antiporter [Myxococcota bacterium]